MASKVWTVVCCRNLTTVAILVGRLSPRKRLVVDLGSPPFSASKNVPLAVFVEAMDEASTAASGSATENRREEEEPRDGLAANATSTHPPNQQQQPHHHRHRWRNVFRRRHGGAEEEEEGSDERTQRQRVSTPIRVSRRFLRHWTAPSDSLVAAKAAILSVSGSSREKVLQKVHFGPPQVREYTAFDWRLDASTAPPRPLALEDLPSKQEKGEETERRLERAKSLYALSLQVPFAHSTAEAEDALSVEQLKAWGVASPGTESRVPALGRTRSLPPDFQHSTDSSRNSAGSEYESENVKDVLAAWCT